MRKVFPMKTIIFNKKGKEDFLAPFRGYRRGGGRNDN